jgi:hypothetical protein
MLFPTPPKGRFEMTHVPDAPRTRPGPRSLAGHCAALLLAACGLAAAPAAHAETFSTCTQFINTLPATLSSTGVYCLAKDVATAVTTGAAITVAANNVTLDCNGYKIGGIGAGPATEAIGILVDGGAGLGSRGNFLLRNCSVRGFHTGLWVRSAPSLVVEDNRFEQSRSSAVQLVYPPGFVLRRNLITDTGGPGVHHAVIASGDGGDIVDNIIRNTFSSDNLSVAGIEGGNCRGCNVTGNRVLGLAGASATGMRFAASGIHAAELRIVGNTVTRLDGTGIHGYGIQANGLCKDNTISGTFDDPVGCSAELDNLANP